MKISRLSLSLIKIHSPVQDFLPFNPSAFSFFLPSFLRQGKHFHVCARARARAVMLSKSNLSRSIYRTISAAPISITALSAIYAPANVSARKDRSRDSFPPPSSPGKVPPPRRPIVSEGKDLLPLNNPRDGSASEGGKSIIGTIRVPAEARNGRGEGAGDASKNGNNQMALNANRDFARTNDRRS